MNPSMIRSANARIAIRSVAVKSGFYPEKTKSDKLLTWTTIAPTTTFPAERAFCYEIGHD